MWWLRQSGIRLLFAGVLAWGCATAQAEKDDGHEVVSSTSQRAQSTNGGAPDEADDGNAGDDDSVASGVSGESLAAGGVDGDVASEFPGDLEAGELELLAEAMGASDGTESDEEMGERLAELKAVFEDAELLSDAEYSMFKALPAAETLEYGAAPETVCGKDDRINIKDTTKVPWRWNCQLIITMANGGKSRCTGWLIGPRTVMTAGHCVYSKGNGGWAKSIEVIPGMNAALKPFGSFKSTGLFSVKGWINTSKPEYDYGAIHINQPIGNKLGWYGFANLGTSSLKGLLVNLAGYPGDKAFGTQWYHWGRITSVAERRLFYLVDTAPGQSGSAVYYIKAGKRFAVGVHAYGGCPNGATRIIKPVYDNMVNWKK